MKNKKIISIIAITVMIINISYVSKANVEKELVETSKPNNEIMSKEIDQNGNIISTNTIFEEKIETEENTKAKEKILTNSLKTSTNELVDNINLKITNIDSQTKMPIAGNVFAILREDKTILMDNLTTNSEGKINKRLDIGKYYLKQISAINNYNVNKALIEIEIAGNQTVEININSTFASNEEITSNDKQINITEETKNILENKNTDVSNIKTTNNNKEIRNQINETNLNNVNNFINTIKRKKVITIDKDATYDNEVTEYDVPHMTGMSEGPKYTYMTRENFIKYINEIMEEVTKIPEVSGMRNAIKLPVASK